MKTYTYNIIAFLLFFPIIVNAQTYDKKITENFKVNSEVAIVIDAIYTDVEIETWNRNEVSIEVVMEVTGVEKSEAIKMFKNWKFEALANKNTVKITSNSENIDFNFNNNFGVSEVEIPYFENLKMNFNVPYFEFPKMPELPQMPEFPEMEFDYEAYKKDSLYLKKYKMQISEHVEKFKNSDWKIKLDSMRNSTTYKKSMEEFKIASKVIANEMNKLQNSEEFKQSMAEAKKTLEEQTRKTLEQRDQLLEQVKLKKEANKVAVAELKRLTDEGKFDSLKNYNTKTDSFINYSETTYFSSKTDKNSKVKIKKYLKIKVPKKAVLELNVRHGKVTIPEYNSKMSVNMNYGNFTGGTITGTENNLTFINTAVVITDLNSSTISLKNVSNANLGVLDNVHLLSNTSDVVIDKIGADVSLNQKFGTLKVNTIISDFKNLSLNFEYAKVTIPFNKLATNYTLNTKKSRIITNSTANDYLIYSLFKVLSKKETGIKGDFSSSEKTLNRINLTANLSTVNIN